VTGAKIGQGAGGTGRLAGLANRPAVEEQANREVFPFLLRHQAHQVGFDAAGIGWDPGGGSGPGGLQIA